ncbi:Mediator of RNA polymerase II transcription subunit 11 [Plasmodiophora brassicae]|uniref:Uncharacterized protein n=2 Tax=Plasmodiophora brassicae TaxID=37360 RepID=A0A3P3YC21_PLABS|nr:unnamed protein product [Plasmodiophora brassicae]
MAEGVRQRAQQQAMTIEACLENLFTTASHVLLDSNDPNDQNKLALFNSLTKFETQCDSLTLYLQNHFRKLELEKAKFKGPENDPAGVASFTKYVERQEAAAAVEAILGPDLALARSRRRM